MTSSYTPWQGGGDSVMGPVVKVVYIYIATIVFDYDHYYYQNYYQYIAIRIILYIISYG